MNNEDYNADLAPQDENEEESNVINVPIHTIILEGMKKHNCQFPEEFIDMMRACFIACLNCHFIHDPKELPAFVDSFCEKIKRVSYIHEPSFHEYIIDEEDETLLLDFALQEDTERHTIAAFTAIVTCLCEAYSQKGEMGRFYENLFSYWLGYRLFLMHTQESHFMPTELTPFLLGSSVLYTPHMKYAVPFQLLNMAFITYSVNEFSVFKKMLYFGFEIMLNDLVRQYDDFKLLLVSIYHVASEKTGASEKLLLIDTISSYLEQKIDKSKKTSYGAFIALQFQRERREQLLDEMFGIDKNKREEVLTPMKKHFILKLRDWLSPKELELPSLGIHRQPKRLNIFHCRRRNRSAIERMKNKMRRKKRKW